MYSEEISQIYELRHWDARHQHELDCSTERGKGPPDLWQDPYY